MGADMFLRTVYLPAGARFDLSAATAMAARLTSQADNDQLDRLANHYDLDHSEGATLSGRRDSALRLLTQLLSDFTKSLHSRDVAYGQFGNTGNTLVDEYATGGISTGDSPTDAYDDWDFLFDTERLPEPWGDYLATAGGLLHPNGDGPVVATVAMRAWSHLPA